MPGKSGKSSSRRKAAERKSREPPLAGEGQEYARVVAMLGNNRVMAKFSDGMERQCRIRGSMRRREWINKGDVVLVALRDLAGDKADIVFKYQQAEVQRLRKLGEPVAIAADEEEAVMEDFVTFEGEPDDDLLPMQQRRPKMPDAGDSSSCSESEPDWEQI